MMTNYPKPQKQGAQSFRICEIRDQSIQETQDLLAIEEPMEIRIGYDDRNGKRIRKAVSITMRTPGSDFELAAGFLYSEGIVRTLEDIDEIKFCGPHAPSQVPNYSSENTVLIELKPGTQIDLKRLERHFYTSSSCGVCGKTSIEALRTPIGLSHFHIDTSHQPKFQAKTIHRLPQLLRNAQRLFESTGGLHASGLFRSNGTLFVAREDVGRHNALDKIVGFAFLQNLLPLSDYLLLVSGRASFELVQKAAMAGIPILAAVGAPSSLAVELAVELDMSLLGFVRDHRFNIYHGARRVTHETSHSQQLDPIETDKTGSQTTL